jgi:hypothetical protein
MLAAGRPADEVRPHLESVISQAPDTSLAQTAQQLLGALANAAAPSGGDSG